MKFCAYGLVFLVIVLLGGCYTPPPVPDAVLQKEYKNLDKTQHAGLPEDMKVLKLQDAINIALANNPDYRSARHSVIAAWARLYSAASDYFPRISAEYNMREFKYVPESKGGSGRDRGGNIFSQKGGGFRGTWELFNGLVTTMSVLSAHERALQAEELDKDAQRLMILNVTNAYYNILFAMERIRIVKEDMGFNESLLKDTKVKYEAGAVPLSEVLNFQVRVNSAKSALVDETFNYTSAKLVLAELMGLTEGKLPDNIEFEGLVEDNSELLSDVEIYLETAIQNRPDLEAMRKAMEAAKYELWSRYGAFMPTLSADIFWGYERKDDGYSGRYRYRPRTQDRSFNYGLNAEWVPFSFGKLARLREAQALLATAKESLTDKWLTVVSEVRQAYDNYRRMQEQVKLYKETLELVKKTRDLVEEEYKAGSTSLPRLNEAQNDLVSAEGQLAASKINLERARVQLKAVVGSL